MPGPVPTGRARRRNPPAIPTTSLPVSGRKGRPPNPPDGYALGKAGRAFWKWAWSRPQACAWDPGALYAVARRAALEDDLATLDRFDPFELAELLGMEENDALRELGFIVGRLKSLAGGRLGVVAKMGELDKRLGLDPKAMAELRWTIVPDEPATTAAAPAKLPANVRRIRAVDDSAAAG